MRWVLDDADVYRIITPDQVPQVIRHEMREAQAQITVAMSYLLDKSDMVETRARLHRAIGHLQEAVDLTRS
jgi:DNA repair photolyase